MRHIISLRQACFINIELKNIFALDLKKYAELELSISLQ
jgi:hypothetical protein